MVVVRHACFSKSRELQLIAFGADDFRIVLSRRVPGRDSSRWHPAGFVAVADARILSSEPGDGRRGSRTTPLGRELGRPADLELRFDEHHDLERHGEARNDERQDLAEEMNETSMTARVGFGKTIRAGGAWRESARGSSRADSFLNGCRAGRCRRRLRRPWSTPPSWRRQSVKPPVEAPTSRQTRPSVAILNESRADLSLSPPRETYGHGSALRKRTAPSAIKSPALPGGLAVDKNKAGHYGGLSL